MRRHQGFNAGWTGQSRVGHGAAAHTNPASEEVDEGYNTYGSVTMGGKDVLIQGNNTTVNLVPVAPVTSQIQEQRYDRLLSSLTFERMDERLRNVTAAMPRTCRWIFSHSQFLAWLNRDAIPVHNGFLWIKGKPGSGKSTLMKEILSWAQETYHTESILYHFFNARSRDPLEKSSLGLHRSLVYQLVSLVQATREPFMKRFRSKVSAGRIQDWTEIELCNFLRDMVEGDYIRSPIKIFVDALDESDDEDVRVMVSFFEELADRAVLKNLSLRILFSSRHYPHISISKGLFITLEEQKAHSHDIDLYIQLRAPRLHDLQMVHLRQRILDKSAGVFLWVVLVVPMLRRIHDRGGQFLEMMQKLDSIPALLHDLFTEILQHDTYGLETSFRLFRWVLCSMEPLTPLELFTVCQMDVPGVADINVDDAVKRFILHCSRGLVEITRTKTNRLAVQFIHETVRDFLTGANLYLNLPLSDGADTNLYSCEPSICHAEIAHDCLRYLLRQTLRKSVIQPPLAWYAIYYWCEHAVLGHEQYQSLICLLASDLLALPVICPGDWFQIHGRPGWAMPQRSILHRTVLTRILYLVKWVLTNFYQDAPGDLHADALAAASERGLGDIVRELLSAGADVNALTQSEQDTALHRASRAGHHDIVRILIMANADVNTEALDVGWTASHEACYAGHDGVLKILLDAGAKLELDDSLAEAMAKAAGDGHREVVEQILKQIGSVNVHDSWYKKATQKAIRYGEERMLNILITAGLDSYKEKGSRAVHSDVLYTAFDWQSEALARLMLDWMSNEERLERLHKVLNRAFNREEWDVVTTVTMYYGHDLLSTCPGLKRTGVNEWYVTGQTTDSLIILEDGVARMVELESSSSDESEDDGDAPYKSSPNEPATEENC